MDLPASLSDEDMELQKKECMLAGVPFSHFQGIITIREDDKSHRYLKLGADTWYYQGYFERPTLEWVDARQGGEQ